MIGISYDKFDMAFWVSSTNMRNMMRAFIDIDVNIGHIEGNVASLDNAVNDLYESSGTVTGDVADLARLLEQHIANQQQINDQFFQLFQDITNILVDHEQRLQNGGL